MQTRYWVIGGVLLSLVAGVILFNMPSSEQNRVGAESAIHSPYAGQETREIKALAPDTLEGLRKGSGTPFGGMAKPAELNGYPGPRHILDAAEAGELNLTAEQRTTIEQLHGRMRTEAIAQGKEVIAIEQRLDAAFANKTMTEAMLNETVTASAEARGQLRFIHLKYHLQMMDVLTEDQIDRYNALRGYSTGGDPCEQVPVGHDPDRWKQHHGCA